ncbi:MAG: hypothetical protein M3315_06375 [Actinomycetota bacterium]|nr:hypothetical protein [Actinomycetota bacterium]
MKAQTIKRRGVGSYEITAVKRTGNPWPGVLTVHLLSPTTNASNGGISTRSTLFTLYASREAFKADKTADPEQSLVVVTRNFGSGPYIHAEPVSRPEGKIGPMAGGCFVYTCDSRYREHVCEYPIPLHDRFETQELYDCLSR